MKSIHNKALWIFVAALGVVVPPFLAEWTHPTPELGQGDVATLETVLARWAGQHEARGARMLHFALGADRRVARAAGGSQGGVALDLVTGQLDVKLSGLDAGSGAHVRLVGDIVAKDGSRLVAHELGQVRADDQGEAHFQARLERAALDGFVLESVVVALDDGGQTLSGSPSFLQRAYYSDKPWAVAALGRESHPAAEATFAFLLPKAALAGTTSAAALAAQIAKGRDLFVNETFGGNGRTCATCHRPDNNHTIDPAYIARLPANDPLFIAETRKELAELENPKLLRQFGLVLANVDGFDRPPVFRSVPHTLGMGITLLPEEEDHKAVPGRPSPGLATSTIATYDTSATNHAIGWSGDGAPGEGTLRAFAKGAVTQHMPKTLHRVEGIDFRLPTAEELDALEAYMLSLGRSTELNLAKMRFISPLAERGKVLFDAKLDEGTGKCKGCHNNAGGNSSTTLLNGNRDTGIEGLDLHPARIVDPTIAFDGGAGKKERLDCGPARNQVCYGDGRFNMTSLIEAADTAPYFHNNASATLEEAIASYNSAAFNSSPGADSSGKPRLINIDSSKVNAIAAFLRAINVLDNLRNATRLAERSLGEKGKAGRETLRLAAADTEDAVEVLRQGYNLNPEALRLIEDALALEKKGGASAVRQAIKKQQDARALIVREEP